MVVDVKKARVYRDALMPIYVELPAEFIENSGVIAVLHRSFFGTRDAALNWANAYRRVLVEVLGFRTGMRSPRSFVHAGGRLRLVVHGDDSVMGGAARKAEELA